MPKQAKPSQPQLKPAAAASKATGLVKHAGGRPKGSGAYRPTDVERRLVERMAAMGVPHAEMVMLLPSRSQGKQKVIEHISVNTLEKHYKAELAAGKLKADLQVVNAFFRNCVGTAEEPGNVAAQIWYTKTRMGWRETLNVAPGAEQPQIQPTGAGQTYDMDDEPNRLENARRVAFLMALGARIARPA